MVPQIIHNWTISVDWNPWFWGSPIFGDLQIHTRLSNVQSKQGWPWSFVCDDYTGFVQYIFLNRSIEWWPNPTRGLVTTFGFWYTRVWSLEEFNDLMFAWRPRLLDVTLESFMAMDGSADFGRWKGRWSHDQFLDDCLLEIMETWLICGFMQDRLVHHIIYIDIYT